MSERPTGLTVWEQELVGAAVSGAVLEGSQQQVGSTDVACEIRAEVLRELLLGRFKASLDPRGIRIRGACITGTLDLTHAQTSVGMELRDCKITKPLLLPHAHLPWLTLTGSSTPALDGEGLQIDSSMFLRGGFRASGHGEDGVVVLRGARIGGELDLSGAELINEDGPALVGEGLQVGSVMFLKGRFRASGRGRRGAVNLRGARIGGQLELDGAELINEDGPALDGERLQVDSSMFLRGGFRASGRGADGAVVLRGARIGGQLILSGAELISEDGPALNGDVLQADSSMILRGGFRASGRGADGAVTLRGARIGGQLDLSGAELSNEDGPALDVDAFHADSLMLLREGFQASGRGNRGAVNLRGARIGGQLELDGAELINEDGPALNGNALQVDSSVFLRGGFRASGRGEDGAVVLRDARIGGQLDLSGAELINEDGPALNGNALQVDSSVFLRGGFRACGRDKDGVVVLRGARIGGQLSLSGAELINEDGPALNGNALQVESSMFLMGGFRASGRGRRGAVSMQGAQIGDVLNLRGADLINPDGRVLDVQDAEAKHLFLPSEAICPEELGGRSRCKATLRSVALSGFAYTTLHGIDWNQWLHLIVRHTGGYSPQPYQQLAAVCRAAGHEADARWVLIAQQQDLRERGVLGGWLAITAHRLWGALAGYGYRTRRTALALLVVLLAAGGLGIAAGHLPTSAGRYVAVHTSKVNDPGSSCSLLEQIGVGIDRGLPLSTTGIRDRCDFDTTSRRGQAITAATWFLQALVWALATLVVVGYTGLIRKVM
jgi:hypothetical protein